MQHVQRWKERGLDLATALLLVWLAFLVERAHLAADGLVDGVTSSEYGLSEQAHGPETGVPAGTGFSTIMLGTVLGFAVVNAIWTARPESTLGGLRQLGRGPRADNLFLEVHYRELRRKGAGGAEAPEPGYLNALDKRWAVLLLPERPKRGTRLRAWTGPLKDGSDEPLRVSGRVLFTSRIERGSPWVSAHVWLGKSRNARRTEHFLAAFAPHAVAET